MNTENEEKIKAEENVDLPCSVVRDLLPLYIDNAVSMDTRKMIASHIGHCEDCWKELKNLQNETGEEKQEEILIDDKEEESSDIDAIPSFRKLRKKLIIRRCLIAFVTALACYLVFALWYNWYHFSETYISLEDSGLVAQGNVLMTTHTIPGMLLEGMSPDDEALYVCVRQTPQAKNSIQILTNKGSIMSLDPENFGKDLDEGADQISIPESVTAIYYLSEEGYKLYQKEDTGRITDLTYAKELSDRIEASSTLLAKK